MSHVNELQMTGSKYKDIFKDKEKKEEKYNEERGTVTTWQQSGI